MCSPCLRTPVHYVPGLYTPQGEREARSIQPVQLARIRSDDLLRRLGGDAAVGAEALQRLDLDRRVLVAVIGADQQIVVAELAQQPGQVVRLLGRDVEARIG